MQSGILEQYVLGILDEAEVAKVEAMLEEHPELWDYVKNLRITLAAVSFQNGVRPPVLKASNEENEVPLTGEKSTTIALTKNRKPIHWFSWFLLAALAGLNIFLAARYQSLVSRYSQLEHQYSSTHTRLNHYQADHATMGLILHQATHLQEIKGEYDGKICRSWIIVNEKEGKAYWKSGDMPALQDDQAFAIWAQVNGEMIPCSPHIQKLDELVELIFSAEADSFHITIENTSEDPKRPNTEMLVASGPADIRSYRAAFDPVGNL